MSRRAVREMKRAVAVGLAVGAAEGHVSQGKECALGLLRRSIHFRHGRLAVIRLRAAVLAGVEVPLECWRYCGDVTRTNKDPSTKSIFDDAIRRAQEALKASEETDCSGPPSPIATLRQALQASAGSTGSFSQSSVASGDMREADGLDR